MKLFHKNKLSFFLISGSLLLLLLFQGVWLKNSYSQEEENLREQADQVFIEAVRGIEDSILYLALKNPNDFYCSDSITFSGMTQAFGIIVDSIDTVIKKVVTTLDHQDRDSVLKLDIRTKYRSTKSRGKFGSLSFFMATTDSSDYYSPFFEECDPNGLTKDLLENELRKTMPHADLPQDYKLAVFFEDKIEKQDREAGFYSNTQKDILRGSSYALFFPKHRAFLLKRILPQLCFSILLFSVILLSFYMIWQSLEKQRRLTELKNDFISNVTHELKTPITTVGVAIEALSNFDAIKNPERTKEYLNISKHELNRLTILVDKVLKMSLFEKQEPELKIESFDLQALVNEVLGSMKLQFDKFTARVNLKTNGGSFALQGDRIHLTSVIYNLIDNALKYSPDTPEIDLLLEEKNNEISLSVKDKGIGIPDVYLDKIFDKFFRVPSGDQHDIKGHGLGLSYVAGVINKHKGKITVDSKKNIGTHFTISLPKVYE